MLFIFSINNTEKKLSLSLLQASALHCWQAILLPAYPFMITPAPYIRIYPGFSAILNWLLPKVHKSHLYLTLLTCVHEGIQVSDTVVKALGRKGLFSLTSAQQQTVLSSTVSRVLGSVMGFIQ